MPDMTEYKCPACGGAMEFNSKIQKMKCPYCDTEMELEEFEGRKEDTSKKSSGNWEPHATEEWQEDELAGMRVYACESCGGEIVADDSTGATSCPFCGNRVVMKGQFEGDLKPDYIIPFKLDKKDAKAAYQKHLEGKAFLPSVFRSQNHIDEIKGVYVPFWLFDADTNASITFKGERTHSWESGDTEYTEHEYFEMYRAGKIGFERIPADGSKKMDDTLMEAIEPFKFDDAVPFKAAYLAGYMADRYDVDMEERIGRAEERIRQSAEDTFRETVKGYHSVSVASSRIDMKNSRYWYALYPVWLLNTTWHDEQFTFAMNGQTGKMVGDLPADNKAFWKYVGTGTVLLGVIIYALMWLFTLI